MKKLFILILASTMLFGCTKKDSEIVGNNESDDQQVEKEDEVKDEVASFDKEAMKIVLQEIVGEYDTVVPPDNKGNFILITEDSISFGKRDEENIAKDFEIINYYTQEATTRAALEGTDEDHVFVLSFYDNLNEKKSSVSLTITLNEELDFNDDDYNQGLAVTFSENDFKIGYIADAFRYEHYRNIKHN